MSAALIAFGSSAAVVAPPFALGLAAAFGFGFVVAGGVVAGGAVVGVAPEAQAAAARRLRPHRLPAAPPVDWALRYSLSRLITFIPDRPASIMG
jgi:hypothetical protein